jgi:cystathionine beta-lyase/cystathionine gamma-synthase
MTSSQQSFKAINNLLDHLPSDWLELTTHRLDIYDESKAKSQFLEQLQALSLESITSSSELSELPTAYDYIRLGHQLSSVLEWLLAEINQVGADQVITFSSKLMPILAILRMNKLAGKQTTIYYLTKDSPLRDLERLESIYGYDFDMVLVNEIAEIARQPNNTNLLVADLPFDSAITINDSIDASINLHSQFGSAIVIHNSTDESAVEDLVKGVQHVRRRESIAMTPPNALSLLREIVKQEQTEAESLMPGAMQKIKASIKENTGTQLSPLIASSGLSIQYAIMMGLVENALVNHPGKPLKIILPPNCYGGTNDQARRVAELVPSAGIIDLLVDGGQELVASLETALQQVAELDGVPLVLAEIPTNPRVEVPDMQDLGEVLSKHRLTQDDKAAVAPTFMVDQTFCPNVKLLHDESTLAGVKVISFSSGSKFPSGGRCIAGYCAANQRAEKIQKLIESHLELSDNRAVNHQLNTLAENMPSMPARIAKAYENTVTFVNHIQKTLPESKINFVSSELAKQGFTPSVFSLDLPTVGNTAAEREEYKRDLNLKLINYMITQHPNDCKYCVSYGQLKGTYWTIPATSTQGTTKEADKDYIVRVAVAPNVDIDKICDSFTAFFRQEKIID